SGSEATLAILPDSTSSCITLCSMGRPWQSQPGTYAQSRPRIVLDRTTRSFSVLFIRWPMWMLPLAYGGPSWKVNLGLAASLERSVAYSPFSPTAFHRFTLAGSFCTRLAFMGKLVLGRLRVSL